MAPPLSLEKFEARLAALEAKVDRAGGAVDSRVPLLATEFDVKTSLFPPLVQAYSTANQALASDTGPTALAFALESFDTDTMHDLVVNNTRVTFNTEGVYYIEGQAQFASNATGDRYLQIYLNGATSLNESRHGTAEHEAHRELVGALLNFSKGDYVELRAYQINDGAAALNVNPARFYAFWIGSLP